MQQPRILIFSDYAPSVAFRGALEGRGFSVTNVSDRRTADASLLASTFDVVVVDFAEAKEGAEFIGRLRSSAKFSQTFVLTLAAWGTGQGTLALARGADAFEPKPIDATRLVSAVERLLQQAKTATGKNGKAATADS